MNDATKSMLLFIFGCLIARSVLAYITYIGSTTIKRVVGLFTLAVAIGFLVIYFGGYRKTGAETFGQPIWWDALRPVHATIYLLVFAFVWIIPSKIIPDTNNTTALGSAWLLLVLDVIIAAVVFTCHHIREGDLKIN